MFEYLALCYKCNKHTIVKTIKRINHDSTQRLPQRTVKCDKCGLTSRVVIIGEILKELRYSTGTETGEYNPELNSYSLRIHMWTKDPQKTSIR